MKLVNIISIRKFKYHNEQKSQKEHKHLRNY